MKQQGMCVVCVGQAADPSEEVHHGCTVRSVSAKGSGSSAREKAWTDLRAMTKRAAEAMSGILRRASSWWRKRQREGDAADDGGRGDKKKRQDTGDG